MTSSPDERLDETVDQTERVARDVAGWIAERLPPTEELERLFDDVIAEISSTVRIPDVRLPEVTEVLDPWGMGPRLRHGADWVEDQLAPLGERMEPVRDRIEALRRRPLPKPDGQGKTQPDAEEDDGWGVIEWVLFGLLLERLSEQELALEIDVDRALWSFDEEEDGRFEVWNKTVFTPAASFAARLGDPLMHGDVVAPGAGSPNVFIGGRPALRSCDVHVCTKATPVKHLSTGFRSTYGGVELNGFPALRVGDYVDEGPHGLNPIVGGCPTVTIGPVAPPVECWSPNGEQPMRRPDLFPFRWRKGELGHFKGKVVLGVGFDGAFARVEGTVTAAHLWAEETTTIDIPLGDFDGDGKDEAQRFTIRTKTERVLGVSEVEIEVRYPKPRPKIEVKPVVRDELIPKPEVKVTREIVEVP